MVVFTTFPVTRQKRRGVSYDNRIAKKKRKKKRLGSAQTGWLFAGVCVGQYFPELLTVRCQPVVLLQAVHVLVFGSKTAPFFSQDALERTVQSSLTAAHVNI